MTTPAIEVTGLVKRYDGVPVVDGIGLTVAPGECFALLGPNGAGKTTTVEILEGFRSRAAGTVRVLGTDPAAAGRRWRVRVGVVSQTVGAALNLTVAETVAHFAHYHPRPRPDGELIEAVGLQAMARTRVPNLSGGQRRRLDVALGVQGRPDLLFLDEPTTGMDPHARRQFWTLIEGLRADGTTVVLTTHYLDEAAHLADRVAVIAHGRVLEVAPPREIGAALRLGATVSWREGGQYRESVTATPTAAVRALLAQHPEGEVDALSVHRPTLEEAYLALLDAADGAASAPPGTPHGAAPAGPAAATDAATGARAQARS